ncbi:hypothetical protein Tco_1462874 [Tanacetum coccineum]
MLSEFDSISPSSTPSGVNGPGRRQTRHDNSVLRNTTEEGPEGQFDITRQARSVKSEEGQVQRSSRPESNDNCGPPCCQDTKELPRKEPTEPENLEVRRKDIKVKKSKNDQKPTRNEETSDQERDLKPTSKAGSRS